MKSQRPSPAALPEPPQLPRFPFSLRSQLCLQPVFPPEGWKSRKRSSAGWWCSSPAGSSHPWLLLLLQAAHPSSSKVLKALTKLRNSSARLLPQNSPPSSINGLIKHCCSKETDLGEFGAHWGKRIFPKRVFPGPPATWKKIPCPARKDSQ